ncbi:hypothetical protein NUW58_g1526 [Xylaria curta]|uniref:Uncharacterized protein n=1 Tax=Xylaria curta TaxID=42375 RepID=A0ACC1PJT8_9PEZI|nr:hypothetical protein NUW58_g1526 [Xylaria curta]
MPDTQIDNSSEAGSSNDSHPTVDIPLTVMSEADAGFRFNLDGIYIPRDTAVLARCEIVDHVHGLISPSNTAQATLLVFDFQLDRNKASRVIHEAVISLILDPQVKVAKGGLSPNGKIWLDAQLQTVEESNEQHLAGAVSYGGSLEIGSSHSKSKKMDVLSYASVNGWTTYWPRPLHNSPKPHNCVKWSLLENPVKKNGIPPHFRAAVLLERQDSAPFQIQIDINSKADLRTEIEDFSILHGRAPMGCLNVDPLNPSTNNIKQYNLSSLKEGIVTVHGLHRTGKEPWQDTNERPKWLEKDLFENFDVRVIVFNYDEVENGLNIYTRRGSILVAQRLLDSIMSWRHSDEESFRPLAFISHDIGGIIVKQVFDKDTATLGAACETAVPLPGTHSTLVIGEEGKSSYKVLRNTLEFSAFPEYKISVWPVSESMEGLWLLSSSSAIQPLCCSYEQPIPLGVLQFSDFTKWMERKEDFHRARWISTNEGRSVHIKSFDSLLQKWQEDLSRPKAVIFTCDLSNYRGLPQSREDNDFSTRIVLATQLSQAIAYALPRTKTAERPKRILDRLKYSHGLMDCVSLLDLFKDVNLWLNESDINAIWGIWNLHECSHDQQVLLVRKLTKCFEFSDFKPSILFIGQDGSEKKLADIMEEANVPHFEQVSTYQPLEGPTHAPEVERLHSSLQGRLELQNLFKKAIQENNSSSFAKILARWIHEAFENGLASKPTERKITSLLEEVCTRPSRLIQVIIESLSDDERKGALRVLCWVTYSLRPLSPSQLAEALLTMDIESMQKEEVSYEIKLNEENIDLNFICGILPELQECLHYMIEIQCNEVRLSHPAILALLPSREFESYVDPAEANLRIFKCLLTRILVQASSTPVTEQSQPQAFSPFSQPYDLAWYATHHWPHHYVIAREHQPTAQRADEYLKDFLENQRLAVKHWLRVSGRVHSPSTSSGDPTPLENLTVLIRSGLYKIAAAEDIFNCSPWDLNVAILESIQCGDLALLTTLRFDSLSQEQVQEILRKAVEANSTLETMEYLFQQVEGRVPIPLPFLIRLAQVGATDSMKAIYQSPQPCISDHDHGTLLLNAVKSQQKEITKMLLELRIVGSDDHVLEAVKEACHIGDPALLQLILDRVSLEQRHTILLYHACGRGNHEVVRVLLQEFDSENGEHRAQLQESPVLALTVSVTKGFMKCTSTILEHYDVIRDQQKLREAITIALNSTKPPQETCQLLFNTGVRFDEGQIPLLFEAAIGQGRLDLVELISDHCGGINFSNQGEKTPLHMAASRGYPRIVEYLLDKGADIDARDSIGCTPIYEACIEYHPQVASLLLSRGADVTLASTRNWSPLEASYDLPDLMKMIVTTASPRPDYKRITGGTEDYTALWLAVKHNYVESVRLLLDHGDPNLEFAPTSESSGVVAGITALFYAVYKGFDEIVRLLLEKGANINHHVAYQNRGSALHLTDSETTIAILLEYNPDLEAPNAHGYSALNYRTCWAAESCVPILRRLANAGANLESGDNRGDTPLCWAVINGNTAAIQYLVSKGAQINTLKPKWGSPVHRAAVYGKPQILRMLVGMGGDPHIEHNLVGSPLQAACAGSGDKEIAEYLVGELGVELNTAGGAFSTVFGQACCTGSLEVLRYLLDNGADTTAVSRAGVPSVFNLCFRQANAVEVLEELLSRDIQIWTMRDCLGRNILHAAAMAGSKELVERLLKYQPDLLQDRDKDGWTVLHWAARRARLWGDDDSSSWPDEDVQKDIIMFLLEKESPGMDERVAVGETSWTPGDLARYSGASEGVLRAFSVTETDGEKQLTFGAPFANPANSVEQEVKGVLYRCKAETCYNSFGLCFKCIAYKELCHDPEHEFEKVGEGFTD